MLPRPLTIAIAVIVTLAWAVNVVYGFLSPARHDPSLNAIFAVVVGAVFALGKGGGDQVSATRKRLARLIAGDAEAREHGNERGEREPDGDDDDR